MAKKIIFYHRTVESMALEVARLSNAKVGQIDWKNFDDTWPNMFIRKAKKIDKRKVVFIANLEDPSTLFEQLAMMYALPMHGAKSFHVIVPFYPVGTMERVSEYGEIATAKSLARMLSAIPMQPIITMIDIHALQMQFYFNDDRIMPRLKTAIPLLKKRIKNISNVAIAFPDEGAYKRFGGMFSKYPNPIVCEKRRVDDKKIVTIKEGEPSGKHVVIVDDLTQTGGTIIECRNALIGAGAAKVSAFITHGVFAKDSWQKFTPGLFDHIWFTDSCPSTVAAIQGRQDFEVLPLAPLIAKLI